MSRFLAAAGPFAPLLVFLLAAAESAAFVGLVVPGELAVILGGVAAGTGSVSLWVMILAAVGGAIAGDSIGYRLGKTLGPTLSHRKRMAKVAAHMDNAVHLLSERGWWALVVARFASVLRAVVPFAAGMGKMPYRRFLFGNVIGGAAWGTAFTLVGYIAGANYPKVEKWFRAGGLAIAGLAVLVGGIVWLTRWAQRNQNAVVRIQQRVQGTRPVRALADSIRRPRLGVFALIMTASGIIGGAWLFGGIVQDILGTEEFFFFDLATIRYVVANQIDQLVSAAKIVNLVTEARFLIPAVAVAAVAAMLWGRRRLAAALVASVAGQWAIIEITETLVHRSPPAAEPLAARIDYGFPSEHVALVTAIAFVAAWAWGRSNWVSTVRRYSIAVTAVVITGAARVILLVEYPSDTIAAAAIAAAWVLIVGLFFTSRPQNSAAIEPR